MVGMIGPPERRLRLIQGASTGVTVWLAYWAVEFLLLRTAKFLDKPQETMFGLWEWQLSIYALGVYLFVGLASGVFVGTMSGFLSSGRQTKNALRAGVTLLLVGASAGYSWFHSNAISHIRAVLLAALIAGGVALWSGLEKSAARWIHSAASPMSVMLLLLGVPWVSAHIDEHSLAWGITGALVFACLAAAAIAGDRLIKSERSRRFVYAGTVLAIVGSAPVASLAPQPLPSRGEQTRDRRPDVILVVMDTVRADHTTIGITNETRPQS